MNETLEARLAEAERRHAEAQRQAVKHAARCEQIDAMDDEAVADLRQRLIDDAGVAWGKWSYAEQAFAVQEFMRIAASQLRRAINGEIAAGRDPYAQDGALSTEFHLHGPEQPRQPSVLETEAKRHRQYDSPSPLKTCQVVSAIKQQIAEAVEAR